MNGPGVLIVTFSSQYSNQNFCQNIKQREMCIKSKTEYKVKSNSQDQNKIPLALTNLGRQSRKKTQRDSYKKTKTKTLADCFLW